MKKPTISTYLIISLVAHLIFLLVSILLSQDDGTIFKKFVVLGKYSQQPSLVHFKQTRLPSGKTGSSHALASKSAALKDVPKPKTQPKKKAAQAQKTKKEQQKKAPKIKVPKLKKSPVKSTEQVDKTKKQTALEEPEATPKKRKKKKREKAEKKEKKAPEPKLETPEEPKEEIKEEPKPEETKPDAEPEKIDADEEPENEGSEEILEFNLSGDVDPRIREYQAHIQKEVSRLWNPPPGVPKGTECVLSFTITKEGVVESHEVVTRSTMLIYDMSILRVAQNFMFDKCLWGKKFILEFRQ